MLALWILPFSESTDLIPNFINYNGGFSWEDTGKGVSGQKKDGVEITCNSSFTWLSSIPGTHVKKPGAWPNGESWILQHWLLRQYLPVQ